MSNIDRIIRTTHAALVTPGITQMPIWVGKPGGGKTEVEGLLARMMGVEPENNIVWIGAQHSPEDYNGWATPRPTGLRFEPPEDIARVCAAKHGMWFQDEIGNMPRATQAGALRAIRERRVGGTVIPPTVMMLAAMNPPESGADAQEISVPLANRSIWLPFPDITDDEHVEYLSRKFNRGPFGVDGEPLPKLDMDKWLTSYAEVVQIHAGFIHSWKPEEGDPSPRALYEDPEQDTVAQRWPLAYCTPRSWDAVVSMAATCRLFGDMGALTDLVIGTIGRPRGLTWLGYYQSNDLFSPEDVLKDPDIFKHDPMRPDRTFAQVRGVAMAACDTRPTPKDQIHRWHQAWRLIQRLFAEGVGKGILVMSGQYLGTHKPKGAVLKEVQSIILELAPMVAASGYDLEK